MELKSFTTTTTTKLWNIVIPSFSYISTVGNRNIVCRFNLLNAKHEHVVAAFCVDLTRHNTNVVSFHFAIWMLTGDIYAFSCSSVHVAPTAGADLGFSQGGFQKTKGGRSSNPKLLLPNTYTDLLWFPL